MNALLQFFVKYITNYYIYKYIGRSMYKMNDEYYVIIKQSLIHSQYVMHACE